MKSCHKAPTWTNLESVMLCKKPGKTRKEAVFLLTAMPSKRLLQSIQVFGCKKTATAMVHCQRKRLIKVNGRPLEMMEQHRPQNKFLELFCFWARSSLLVWISGSMWRTVVMGPKFMLSNIPSPNPWWLITKNMWMRPLRKRSKISSSSIISPCL